MECVECVDANSAFDARDRCFPCSHLLILTPSHCRARSQRWQVPQKPAKGWQELRRRVDLTVTGATSDGRWTSHRAPFAAAALVTAQLVMPRAHSCTNSHLHITPSEGPLSHSPPHTHRQTRRRLRAGAAAAGRLALVRGLACVPEAARRRKTLLSACSSAQLPDCGQMH